jgi:hypothetical protein
VKGASKLIGDAGIVIQDILLAENQEYDQLLELRKMGKVNGKIHIEAHSKGSRRMSIQLLTTAKRSFHTKASSKALDKPNPVSLAKTSSTPDKDRKISLTSRGTKPPKEKRTHSKGKMDKKHKRGTESPVKVNSSDSLSSAGTIDETSAESVPVLETLTIDDCVQSIADGELSIFVLNELKRLLSSEDCLSDFLNQGGFFLLLSNIVNAKYKPNTEAVQVAILDIISASLSTQSVFIKVIVESSNTLKTIILSADSEFSSVKTRTYNILADIPTIVLNLEDSAGYQVYNRIMEAVNYYNFKTAEKSRFQHLVQGLQHDDNDDEKIAILKLIHVIINGCEEPDDRMAIRGEFIALGLDFVFEELKKKVEGEENSTIMDLITKFDVCRESDDQELKNYLSYLVQYNLDWRDNRSFALLCGAVLQRVIKNDWLRRVFFEIMGRFTCIQTDDNVGLAKSYLILKFLLQLGRKDKKLSFDYKTSIDIQELLDSIKQSDLTVPTSETNSSDINEKYDQLSHVHQRLQIEIEQTKEQLETLRLEKEAELEELKKQLESKQFCSSETEDFQHYRNQERMELQTEIQFIEQQKQILFAEKEALRNVILEQFPSAIEHAKKTIPTLFEKMEEVEDKKNHTDDEQYRYHDAVVKEWLGDLLQMDLSQSDLHKELLDGSLLCKAMNILRPGSIRKYYPSPKITMLRMENIGFFSKCM